MTEEWRPAEHVKIMYEDFIHNCEDPKIDSGR